MVVVSNLRTNFNHKTIAQRNSDPCYPFIIPRRPWNKIQYHLGLIWGRISVVQMEMKAGNRYTHSHFTFALNWRQVGHARPWPGNISAWAWATNWRLFIRTSHSQASTISCGNNSHPPSLWTTYQRNKSETNKKIAFIKRKLIRIHELPEVLISIYCLVTSVTKVLTAVLAHHLVATFSFGDRHLASRALLGITHYLLDAQQFVDHLTFSVPLMIL